MKENKEQAVIPMERYNELLTIEKKLLEGQEFIKFNVGYKSFFALEQDYRIYYNKIEGMKEVNEVIQQLSKEVKETNDKNSILSMNSINFERHLERCLVFIKEISDTWWYKTFASKKIDRSRKLGFIKKYNEK